MPSVSAPRERPLAVRRILVRTWSAYLELIVRGAFAGWAFRGQADARWPLETSLARYLRTFAIDPRVWQRQEERALRIFKRKAHALVQHLPDAEGDFEWLALMEHHGAPTRLLDFTWSPYVAAFFALETATTTAAVWAIDPVRVVAAAQRRTGVRSLAALDPRRAAVLARRYLAGRQRFVWVGEPERMNPRLVAQSGTFCMPSVLEPSVDQLLAQDPIARPGIVRLELDPALRTPGLRQLYQMNVTRSTLFPGLDGLGGSLAYELEFHWQDDPRAPRPRRARPRTTPAARRHRAPGAFPRPSGAPY